MSKATFISADGAVRRVRCHLYPDLCHCTNAHGWECPCETCEQTRAAGLEYVGNYDEEE